VYQCIYNNGVGAGVVFLYHTLAIICEEFQEVDINRNSVVYGTQSDPNPDPFTREMLRIRKNDADHCGFGSIAMSKTTSNTEHIFSIRRKKHIAVCKGETSETCPVRHTVFIDSHNDIGILYLNF
jgi:hypothetical protein